MNNSYKGSLAQQIVKALGGHGSDCRCPAHNDKKPSLSVTDAGDGHVMVNCFAGCDWRDVKAELRHRGLLPEWNGRDADPEFQAKLATERRKREKQAEKEKAERIQWAASIWKEAAGAENSPVQAYLGSRGITTPLPPTIRFHRALRYNGALYFGGMIGAVARWPSSKVIGIHRTFLLPGGTGKAQVSSPKKMAGDCRGGAVRLAPAGETITITEGIENGLSVMQATGIPAWAALSAGGIEALVLPELPLASGVTIAADNDSSGRGQEAAEIAAERWSFEGRNVRIALPPVPGTDFNDMLLEGGIEL